MQIFETASRHMDWLALRQSVTASNIANADTPGYRSRDIMAFEQVLEQAPLDLETTSDGHLAIGPGQLQDTATLRSEGWDRSYSGNDVTLEQELIKAGETSRMMGLDSALARSFHRMLMSSLKV
jgi:flagellar basal-body rod protein FlgB